MLILVDTFCIGGKCSVVLSVKKRNYGGVSSLNVDKYVVWFVRGWVLRKAVGLLQRI